METPRNRYTAEEAARILIFDDNNEQYDLESGFESLETDTDNSDNEITPENCQEVICDDRDVDSADLESQEDIIVVSIIDERDSLDSSNLPKKVPKSS